MLADFFITRLSNDMKIAVHKNHLGGEFFFNYFLPGRFYPDVEFYDEKTGKTFI